MSKQKFHNGDMVRVAKDLGSSMRHFKSDCDAIVIASYKDSFGGDDTKSYTIHIKDHGKTSWYYEHQLTLVSTKSHETLVAGKREQDERTKESDMQAKITWIVKHWKAKNLVNNLNIISAQTHLRA